MVNYAFFALLLALGLHYLAASATGYVSGIVVSFAINRRFIFRATGAAYPQFLRYSLAYAGALVAQLALLETFVQAGLPPFVANGIALLVVVIANYFVIRRLVFGQVGLGVRAATHARSPTAGPEGVKPEAAAAGTAGARPLSTTSIPVRFGAGHPCDDDASRPVSVAQTAAWALPAMLFLFALAAAIGNIREVSPWRLTQWWLSYDLGFVKRGLMGTLLRPLAERMGHEASVHAAAVAILVVAIISLVAIAAYLAKQAHWTPVAVVLSVAFVTMPGSVATIATDLGRFDGVLVAIAVASLGIMLLEIRSRAPLAALVSFALLQPLAVFVHEIYVVVAGPLLATVAAASWRRLRRGTRVMLAATAVLAIGLTGVTMVVGGLEATAEQLYSIAATQLTFEPSLAALAVPTSTLRDNLAFAFSTWLRPSGWLIVFATALGVTPAFVVVGATLRWLGTTDPRSIGFVAVPALAPFSLLLVGIDAGRWGMFASLNAMLCAMILLTEREQPPASRRLLAWLVGATVAGAAIGGMGATGVINLHEALVELGRAVVGVE